MIPSLQEAAAAAKGPRKKRAHVEGGACEIRGNHEDRGHGFFSAARWSGGEKYFAGKSRQEAVMHAVNFACDNGLEPRIQA